MNRQLIEPSEREAHVLAKRFGAASLLAGLLAAACSPYPDRAYGVGTPVNGGGNGGTQNPLDDASTGTSGGGGAGGSSVISEGGVAGNGGSAMGGPDGGGFGTVPTKGLVVIGGTALDGTSGLISVLSPTTGKELKREMLPPGARVAGIAYDGAAKKDVWYVFVGADYPAKADKVVELQVRYFSDSLNTWTTLSKATTLPPPVPDTFAVLNDRLAYLSHVVKNNMLVAAVTLLDTSDLTNVKSINVDLPMLNGSMITLLGTRGSVVDPNGVGGVIDVGVQQNCSANSCDLFVQPFPVGTMVGMGIGHLIGSFAGTLVAAASHSKQLNYYAGSPAAGGSVKVFRATPDAPESAQNFAAPPSATDLRGLTVAECQDVAIFTADLEKSLYGVNLTSSLGKSFSLGRSGQLVAYEPFTTNVIATFNPAGIVSAMPDAGGGPEIAAIRVTSPLPTSLTIDRAPAAMWAPPTDVRPEVLVTRFPVPFKCP
jgi:hypothetical protein